MERRRLLDSPGDLCARVVIGALFLILAWRLGGDFSRTHRITDLLLLVGEGLVVILTILRRHATTVDRRLFVRVATALSMASPFLVRPGPVGGLIPEPASVAIATLGLSIVVAGKVSLGYSFGLLPANRGLVDGGVYRFVRHPIYVGYLLSHVGFLLSHPTVWNLAAFAVGDIMLIGRAIFEEQTLALDSAYGRYCQQVRWRLVPGLY
jgi:protein-S-isoprenylcysteine O-methyltransferase Ste14